MRNVVIHRTVRLLDDFFKVDEVEVSYERFDGQMSEPMRRLCFDRGDSVAAIIFNRSTQRVLLVEQFRLPALNKGPAWMLELVAGIKPPGESPEEALRREVLEETGYEIDRLHCISTFYPSPGGSSEQVMLYMAEVTGAGRVGPGGGLHQSGEDIRVVEFGLDDLRQEMAAGRICDAKTLIGVMWLFANPAGYISPPTREDHG
jgi:nudix-type nucleoside diphosphatase (YffH/AdpP family)